MPLPRGRLELALHPVQAIDRPVVGSTPLLRPSPPDLCGRSYQSEDRGRRVKELFDPGRQPGQGALVVRLMRSTATDRRFASQTPPRRTSCRPSPDVARRVGRFQPGPPSSPDTYPTPPLQQTVRSSIRAWCRSSGHTKHRAQSLQKRGSRSGYLSRIADRKGRR